MRRLSRPTPYYIYLRISHSGSASAVLIVYAKKPPIEVYLRQYISSLDGLHYALRLNTYLVCTVACLIIHVLCA